MLAQGISALLVTTGATAIGHTFERSVTRGAVFREQRMADGERPVGDDPTPGYKSVDQEDRQDEEEGHGTDLKHATLAGRVQVPTSHG